MLMRIYKKSLQVLFILMGTFAHLQASENCNTNTESLIISGGGGRDTNFSRYENNVALFNSVLKESGCTDTKILFNKGKDSEVRDLDILNWNIYHRGETMPPDAHEYTNTKISNIIDGPATKDSVLNEMEHAKAKKPKRFIMFSSDHGTPNYEDPSKSSITLEGEENLTVDEQNKFVKEMGKKGSNVVLIGDQCFSGHNMQIALKNSNACAFSSAAPFEPSGSLDGDAIPKDSGIPQLGYSAYSFFFSCGLHRSNESNPNNSAKASKECPKESTDINGDGNVTFAKAHFYALTKMDPDSTPRISSQVYARDLLKKHQIKNAGFISDFAAEICKPFAGDVTDFNKIQNLIDPAMELQIKNRIKMENAALSTLLKDQKLKDQLHVNADDSTSIILAKTQQAYLDYQDKYNELSKKVRENAKEMNLLDKKAGELKNKMLVKINEKPEVALLLGQYEEAAKVKKTDLMKELNDKYSQAVDKYTEKNPAYVSIVKKYSELSDVAEGDNGLQHQFVKLNRAYASVRRAYDLSEGIYAEKKAFREGTLEEKTKLLQLYECENQTL